MSVYVDTVIDYGTKGLWCHMMADALDELHSMADEIGLKRAWFQNNPTHPHYDLRPSKRALAIKYGAIEMTQVELFRKCCKRREKGGEK